MCATTDRLKVSAMFVAGQPRQTQRSAWDQPETYSMSLLTVLTGETSLKPQSRCCVLLCFINPRVRKIWNEASSCLGKVQVFLYMNTTTPFLFLTDFYFWAKIEIVMMA